MPADERTHRWRGRVWRAICRAAAYVATIHREQSLMWDAWWQANRVSGPDSGALTWVLTLNGHRLAGSHLPASGEARTGGMP